MQRCKFCQQEFEPKRFKDGRQQFCSHQCRFDFHKQVKRNNNAQRHREKPLQCNFCHKKFVASRRVDEIFCSDECRENSYKNRIQSERIQKRSLITRRCKLCDKEFTPEKTTKQIYCSKYCRRLIPRRAYAMLRRCYEIIDDKKRQHTHEVLGYTPAQLQEHIQSHPNWPFVKDKSWHLDHIFPVIAFIEHDIRDLSIICCLENLQPLLDEDNHKKNGKYDKKEFEKWMNHYSQSRPFTSIL